MFRTWLLARFTEVYRPQAEASAAPRIYAKCLDGDNALICQCVHAALGHATSIPTPRTCSVVAPTGFEPALPP
jgi:hypothetical protein